MKRAAVVLATVLATSLLPPAAGAATTAHDDSIAAGLRDAASRGVLDGLEWPRFPYYRDELRTLYEESGWRPMWTAGGKPTAPARAAVDALLGAEERGLHPAEYNAGTLERRFEALSSTRSATARDVAWFDVALSVGLMRHVSDVHIGRVNPKNVAVGINVEPKKLDLAHVLRESIEHGRVAEMVHAAEPKFVQYRNLKAAYARYRKLPELPTVATHATVRPGEHFDGAAALWRRLALMGDLPGSDVNMPYGPDSTRYDGGLAGAVARFQDRHGLAPDSVLGPTTLAAINVPMAQRTRQLELSMERIRWLPELDRGPFVIVNIPSFRLYAFDTLGTGVPTMTMNVVVGRDKVGRRTPMFERDMKYIVFRPYWVVTRSITKKEVLPAVRRNSSYLKRNDMEIYSGGGDNGPTVATTPANIQRVAKGELGIRQRPGPKNSLGLAKFIFPNDMNIYMHGTPATELFSRARRDFSHGCIRLEDPAKMAVWVLRDPAAWPADSVRRAMDGPKPRTVFLAQPLPVVIYYSTAVVRPDGKVAFFDDVYRHDAELEQALAKGYPFPP